MSEPYQKQKQYAKRDNQSVSSWEQFVCPVCGEKLIQEKCKVVCRSKICVYRIIYNCSEF